MSVRGLRGGVLSDADACARITAEAKERALFAYAGKTVLAKEEPRRPCEPDPAAEAA